MLGMIQNENGRAGSLSQVQQPLGRWDKHMSCAGPWSGLGESLGTPSQVACTCKKTEGDGLCAERRSKSRCERVHLCVLVHTLGVTALPCVPAWVTLGSSVYVHMQVCTVGVQPACVHRCSQLEVRVYVYTGVKGGVSVHVHVCDQGSSCVHACAQLEVIVS